MSDTLKIKGECPGCGAKFEAESDPPDMAILARNAFWHLHTGEGHADPQDIIPMDVPA